MERIQAAFEAELAASPDLYTVLNAFRAWFNANLANYELFLEDDWFEDGHTVIEYTLRSLDTFNIQVVAEDTYDNHRDAKGIWHLGPYRRTAWTVDDPWQIINGFFAENTPPKYKAH